MALTVMIFYSLSTLVAVVWPAPFLGFMNALFHGIDFKALTTVGAAIYMGRVFFALVVMGLWAFAIGAFFAWLQRLMSGGHVHE